MKIIGMSAYTLADVAALEEECFTHPWAPASLEESFSNPAYLFFVGKTEENKVVGYISYYQIRDEAFVNNVAVTAAARRQGVGRALVRRAVQSASDNGASFLSLEVRRSNAAAIALYESEGFDLEGVRKIFYRDPDEDAFIMTRRMTPAFQPGLGGCGPDGSCGTGNDRGIVFVPDET